MRTLTRCASRTLRPVGTHREKYYFCFPTNEQLGTFKSKKKLNLLRPHVGSF